MVLLELMVDSNRWCVENLSKTVYNIATTLQRPEQSKQDHLAFKGLDTVYGRKCRLTHDKASVYAVDFSKDISRGSAMNGWRGLPQAFGVR